jgi:hypothetical protein
MTPEAIRLREVPFRQPRDRRFETNAVIPQCGYDTRITGKRIQTPDYLIGFDKISP